MTTTNQYVPTNERMSSSANAPEDGAAHGRLSPRGNLPPLPHPSFDAEPETSITLTPSEALSLALADGGSDHVRTDALCRSVTPDPSPYIAEIRETHRQRRDLLSTELSIRNRVWAIHDRMNTPAEVRAARSKADWAKAKTVTRTTPESEAVALAHTLAADSLLASRTAVEKRLEALARHLPVWEWVEACRGVSALSLAQIVGETGDFANYANPAKLWKRLGLAVMPDGTRQRLVAGAAAFDHGYNPTRRSVMWIVGDNLIRSLNPEYYLYYRAEKERLALAWPDAPPIHIHKAAHRHMEKRFIKELWRAWMAIVPVSPMDTLSDAPAANLMHGGDA